MRWWCVMMMRDAIHFIDPRSFCGALSIIVENPPHKPLPVPVDTLILCASYHRRVNASLACFGLNHALRQTRKQRILPHFSFSTHVHFRFIQTSPLLMTEEEDNNYKM